MPTKDSPNSAYLRQGLALSLQVSHRVIEFFRGNRQVCDLNTNGVIDRIRNSRGGGNGPVFADGFGLKWPGAVVISDIERLMPRNILDIRKFVFTEIIG